MKHVLLDNINHKDLRIITKKSAEYGNAIGSTLTFPTEFTEVQSEYPIFFRKDPETQAFQSVVLFGLQDGENLFLEGDFWRAHYIPIAVNRDPFLIGFQNQQIDGENKNVPVLHVDMDSPRISYTEGERVFLEHGGNSPYLERVSRMMDALHNGMQLSNVMFQAFLEYDLIEPCSLDVELNNGEKHVLRGYYTISQDNLNNLSSERLARLHSAGFLQCAFMVLSSMVKVRALIDKKNSRL